MNPGVIPTRCPACGHETAVEFAVEWIPVVRPADADTSVVVTVSPPPLSHACGEGQ